MSDTQVTNTMHKSGFVNIVGNPNVGKSTLMNRLVGDKISIITSKAQTTRHRLVGIVNTPDMQIVYNDTPGVLTPVYKMQEHMLGFARAALSDADILLYVTDTQEDREKHADFIEAVRKLTCPILVLINKADLSDQEHLTDLIKTWSTLLPQAEVVPISALHGAGVDFVKERIADLLPESPPYYDKEAYTDRPARFFVSEIIREKILLYYQQEIPYSVEVVVESYKESDQLLRIAAVIYVERESQKGILIGKQGAAIKKLGTVARQDIERFFDKKVFLELFVKVERDWRNKEGALRTFGYKQD